MSIKNDAARIIAQLALEVERTDKQAATAIRIAGGIISGLSTYGSKDKTSMAAAAAAEKIMYGNSDMSDMTGE